MARLTLAQLQEKCEGYRGLLSEKNAHINQLQAALDLSEQREQVLKDNLASEQINKRHAQIMGAQMQGFIRAHHTEKREMGQSEQYYDPSKDQWTTRPVLVETYPFMEIQFE